MSNSKNICIRSVTLLYLLYQFIIIIGLVQSKKYKYIIAVDPGSLTSGVVTIVDGIIKEAIDALPNEEVYLYILRSLPVNRHQGNAIALIEDIKPYSVKLSQQTIDTAKFIGELRYCLQGHPLPYKEIPRSAIKEWINLQYRHIVRRLLDKKVEYRSTMNDRLVLEGKIEKNNLVKKDGDLKAATYVWIDDRMVSAAMRAQWDIKKPKPGHKSELGLKNHSFQALALATYYLKTY